MVGAESLQMKQEPRAPIRASSSFQAVSNTPPVPGLQLSLQSRAASLRTPVDTSYATSPLDGLTSSDPSAVATPDSQTGSILSAQAQPSPYLMQPQSNTNDFFNLNAMMFPSADPFAYPNNPITILENQQSTQRPLSSTPVENSILMPDQIVNNTYDNVEVQLYGPLPPYLAQAQQAMPGISLPVNQHAPSGTVPSFPNVYMPRPGAAAGQQAGFNLDEIFGNNEWSSNNFLIGHQNRKGFSG